MWVESDKFHDECGVVGIFGHAEASNLAYLGLYSLQHRGQESAGIASVDEGDVKVEVGMGLVADVFTSARLERLPGNMAIGHNRYSTTGESHVKNAQPCVIKYSHGSLALAHNGNLVNADGIREQLVEAGSIFQSTNDSEVVLHLIAQSQAESLVERVTEALSQVQGAYSLVLMSENEIIAARDPHGFRPLVLGEVDGAPVVSSESCVMDLIGAKYIREVKPGEILRINDKGVTSYSPFPSVEPKKCIFEHIYFARPDSVLFGEYVYNVRKRMGKTLSEQAPVDADIVVPVPDSGNLSALGYAEASGIPFEMALIRNHYVGRTFIEPQSQIRHFGVRVKLNAVKELIVGKRVIIIDDSIVRGTTSRKIVKMMREAGATEVHVRISSPPSLYSCFYGIDTPTSEELIASTHNLEETRKFLTADTLEYLDLNRMLEVMQDDNKHFCTACFSGDYPVTPHQGEPSNQLPLFGGEATSVPEEESLPKPVS